MMRRTFAAVTAATATVLSLGFTGTALADQEMAPVPFGAYISEVATQGTGTNATFKEFIEISNRGNRNVALGGHRVVANVGSLNVEIAQIPNFTVLAPGETYLLASQRFTGPAVPDQLFSTDRDIPNAVGLALMNRSGEPVDTVATTFNTQFRSGSPAAPLTAQEAAARQSLHRVQFTGNDRVDFRKLRATPGLPG